MHQRATRHSSLRTAPSIRHLLATLVLVFAGSANAQTSADLSGAAFIDFVHFLDSQDADLKGNSYFTYRRIYLTSDFDLPSDFSARLRLEADESSSVPSQPDIRLKDAYVRWQFHDGHHATIGVQPTPVFDVAEEVWGYRGLEQVLVDLSGLRSSRALGLLVAGRLNASGSLRYRAMIANHHDSRTRADHLKHVFGQLEASSGPWFATLGANYTAHGDARSGSFMVNGILAHVSNGGRLGVDWFVQQTRFSSSDDEIDAGVSIFGERSLTETWSVVARIDRFSATLPPAPSTSKTFGIVGISYQPIEQLRIVPNVYWLAEDDADDDDARIRLTVILEI